MTKLAVNWKTGNKNIGYQRTNTFKKGMRFHQWRDPSKNPLPWWPTAVPWFYQGLPRTMLVPPQYCLIRLSDKPPCPSTPLWLSVKNQKSKIKIQGLPLRLCWCHITWSDFLIQPQYIEPHCNEGPLCPSTPLWLSVKNQTGLDGLSLCIEVSTEWPCSAFWMRGQRWGV